THTLPKRTRRDAEAAGLSPPEGSDRTATQAEEAPPRSGSGTPRGATTTRAVDAATRLPRPGSAEPGRGLRRVRGCPAGVRASNSHDRGSLVVHPRPFAKNSVSNRRLRVVVR